MTTDQPFNAQPAAILPAFLGIAKHKLGDLLTLGYRINGFAIAREVEGSDPQRGFITVDGLVCWWTPGLQALERAHEAMEKLRVRCEQAEAAIDAAQAVERERDELRDRVEALTKHIRPVYLVATGEVHEGQETYTRHDAPVPMADQEVLFTRPPNPLTRPAVPAEMAGIFREALAWGRVWGPLLAGNLWDDMREKMVSEFARRALSSPKHQEQANLPDGWVPCTVTFDRGYPEDVAYGPQRMMERLQKWLGKHFAREIRDSLKDAAGETAKPEAYAPLTPDEVRDLTCMQAGAPWADAPLGALAEVIAIYEQLRQDGKRPVDPSTLPEDQVRFPYVATQTAKHPDDLAIDRFAAAMKAKMAEARDKGRYGWEECPPNDLSWMLREHVDKGDPRDVANFCMMLWNLGASIAGPLAKHQPCGCVLCTCQDDGQCHGCGAKHCGTHPVGQFSNSARESCHQSIESDTEPKQSIAELRASALKRHNEYMSKASEPIQDDLYWRLESLSKSLESCDRIDSHDNQDAYATILDAMNYVRGIKP